MFMLAGTGVAVRGEWQARELEHLHAEILAALPDRARKIEQQLTDPSLDTKTREQLERKLDDCNRGVTRIRLYEAGNYGRTGYGCGVVLAAMGLACLRYKPKPPAGSTSRPRVE